MFTSHRGLETTATTDTIQAMEPITEEEYRSFLSARDVVVFGDRLGKRSVEIPLGNNGFRSTEPTDFDMETTTVWSFPKRGTWATHRGNFRGNWSPQVVRNFLLRYSQRGDTVLDQMCGSGTTLVECKLLERNSIGVDVNPHCVMLSRDRLNFDDGSHRETEHITFVGDARNLNLISDDTVDLVATHPPYLNIIPYSKDTVEGDLSSVRNLEEYVESMGMVASESLRVLGSGGHCAVLMGDTRRNKHYVPVAFRVMEAFLEAGFVLREDVIKKQWRCKSTPFWTKRSVEYNFLLIMHEHLFVFRKPARGERVQRYRDSMSWT